jgi:ElaB/YqjD/DUF883 family membrane-anchored ribosome-binding protein
MATTDTDDKVAQGKQKLQDLGDAAKDKARSAADTAKDKASGAAETSKEHPTRTGGIAAAVVGGLAAVWALRRKLRRRRQAGESS